MTDLLENVPLPIVYVSLAVVLVLHLFVLSNRRQAWPGAVLPAVWVVIVVVLAASGRLDVPRDLLASVVVLGLLVFLWISARRSRATRVARRG